MWLPQEAMTTRSWAVPLCLVFLLGCRYVVGDGKETARVSSTDGKVDAVLVETPTHATVPTVTELFIVPRGARPVENNLVLRVDHAEQLALRWEADRLLAVSYRSARIHQFTNFWLSAAVDNFDYRVEIKLQPTAERSVK